MAKKTIDQIDASLARWQTRLKRAVNTIERLQKQRKRLTRPQPLAQVLGPIENVGSVAPIPKKLLTLDELDIPTFLQRDKAAAAEVAAEQADIKKRKAAGRIAKMKAKQSGETKRMPLTGKAALEAIRNG